MVIIRSCAFEDSCFAILMTRDSSEVAVKSIADEVVAVGVGEMVSEGDKSGVGVSVTLS